MTEDFKLRINNVWVVVSSEPIEALGRTGRFHALVSSDNASLSMEGGVAKAIRVASGEAILDEAQKLVPLRLGDVAVTSAGQLPARYVLHAVTVDRFLAVRPSELTIRVAAENVFRRCELLAVRRLAMPALGTGAAQFAADHCAKVIVGALLKHTASPTVMEEVVFSLPHQDARSAFHNFLQRAHLHDGGNLDTAAAAEADVSTKAAGLSPDTTQSRESHNRVAAVATASRPLVSNRYVLLEEIGRGGMAIVYLAWDIVLRQVVAIKTLPPGDHLARERVEGLRQEAALQIGLVHQGIVRLLHFEPWDAAVGPYIIMEYVPWTSGERWMAEAGLSRLPLRSVLSVGICLCEALTYAHNVNVLHGDIKPSNVFVSPGADAAKLADFGIARVVGGVERNALVTRPVGTPSYMSPEQRLVGAKVGPRTDLYLLARTLAEFIGARPNRNGDVDLPEDVSTTATAALRRGLAREPTSRPADAREFGRLLQDAFAAVP